MYGTQSQWGKLGEKQARRIKNAQFDENSKLCMCVLKAMNQETVDIHKDRKLRQRLHTAAKHEMREHKRKMKESMATSTATLPTPGIIENHHGLKGPDHGQSQPVITNENLLVNIKQQPENPDKAVKLNKNLVKQKAFDPYNGQVCQNIKKVVSTYYT